MGLVVNLPFTLTNGTTADATQVMANYQALVDAFTLAAAAGVNADITALTALSTPLVAASGGSTVYVGGTSGGSANAQTIATLVPISFGMIAGRRVTFIAGFTNTGAMTLNANSQGAVAVQKVTSAGPAALTGGEVVAGNIIEAVVLDATTFLLLSVPLPTTVYVGGTSGGSANAQTTATLVPSGFTLTAGKRLTFIAGFTNTGATTLAANGLAATAMRRVSSSGLAALAGGEIVAGNTIETIFDGTFFVLLSVPNTIPRQSTRQVLLSGTGATYTTPAGCQQLKIRMVGAGGGGGANTSGNNDAGTGGTTSITGFTAIGGTGGALAGAGGAGGTGGSGTGAPRLNGAKGGAGMAMNSNPPGGTGGVSPFGGAGNSAAGAAGGAAAANTGSGGSGAGASGGGTSGGGGGAGEYVEIVISSPSATYTYTIGAGGTGGTGGNGGGAGGSGIIIVDEFY